MSVVWFCKISGNELGPLSAQQLRAMAAEGRLGRGDHVRQGAEGTWIQAARVQGLFPTGEPAAARSVPRRLPVAKPLESPPVAGAPAAQPAHPSTPKAPVAPLAQPAPGRAAKSQVPQAQSPPKVPSASAAAQSPAAGTAGLSGVKVNTQENTSTRSIASTSAASAASRRKTLNNVLVVGSLAVLIIVLAVAGAWLVRANRDPGQPADTLAEAPADATPLPGEPADTKWLDASKSPIRRGDVSARISSVTLAGPRAAQQALQLAGRPKRDLLLIAVELENTRADRELQHLSWGGYGPMERRAMLRDNLGKTNYPIRFRGAVASGQAGPATIGPNERIEDLLVFEPPAEGVEFLLLQLPAAFGQPDALRFKIPAEMIVTADEPPEPQDPARPSETGVPEINRGIRELESDEDPAGPPDEDPDGDPPSILDDYPELRGDSEGADEDFPVEGKFDNVRPPPDERDR